jgi:hypothetical protein
MTYDEAMAKAKKFANPQHWDGITREQFEIEYTTLCLPQTSSHWWKGANRVMLALMGDMLKLIWCVVIGLFRSRASLN